MLPQPELPVTPMMKEQLRSVLEKQDAIFSYQSEPWLASLLTCMGIQFEMGKPEWDRLSVPLGIEISSLNKNPWHSKIIIYEEQIGICLWIPEVKELTPRHPDFKYILHPLSLDEHGKLSRVVIFPNQVAQNYSERGLDLVIVKDWVLSSFLSNTNDDQMAVNYLKANPHEIITNSAKLQSRLMARNQLAFSGTHDLVDHLLDGSAQGFSKNFEFYQRVLAIYDFMFTATEAKKSTLIVSYILGVLLDDMAQPKWYNSEMHLSFAQKTLNWLTEIEKLPDQTKQLVLPQSFSKFMHTLRENENRDVIQNHFIDMQWQLSTQ